MATKQIVICDCCGRNITEDGNKGWEYNPSKFKLDMQYNLVKWDWDLCHRCRLAINAAIVAAINKLR